MRKFLIAGCLFCLVACQKDQQVQTASATRTDFFANNVDALKTVQQILDKSAPGEKVDQIESISYIDARAKSFAFVFYHSNKGKQNLVIQKNFVGEDNVQVTSTKCDGEDCSCKVKTIISENGDVSVDCSCKSCTMLINNSVAPPTENN